MAGEFQRTVGPTVDRWIRDHKDGPVSITLDKYDNENRHVWVQVWRRACENKGFGPKVEIDLSMEVPLMNCPDPRCSRVFNERAFEYCVAETGGVARGINEMLAGVVQLFAAKPLIDQLPEAGAPKQPAQQPERRQAGRQRPAVPAAAAALPAAGAAGVPAAAAAGGAGGKPTPADALDSDEEDYAVAESLVPDSMAICDAAQVATAQVRAAAEQDGGDIYGAGDDVYGGGDDDYEYDDDNYYMGEEGEEEEDGGAPPLVRNTSYQVMTQEQLVTAQHRMVTAVSERWDVTVTDAAALLRHAAWDRDALDAALSNFSAREEYARKAGASLYRPPKPDFPQEEADSGELMCNVCFCDLPKEEDAWALQCGHWFCRDCWRAHVENALDTLGADAIGAKCQEAGCATTIDDATFRMFSDGPRLERYNRQLYETFVSRSEDVTFCPRKGCEKFIAFSQKKRTVRCDCGLVFCFQCRKNPHAPTSCAQRDAWKKGIKAKKDPNKAKLSEGLKGKIKPCPKCRAASEKISGCMYVVCHSCKTPWCWQCGQYGPNVHHVFDCSDPVNEEWAKLTTSDLFTNDARFDWYYERYSNHKDSLKFAEVQLQEARAKGEGMMARGVPVHEVQFILETIDLIIRCRRALAWCYAFAYFVKDSEQRKLFEFSQKDLETYTEQLSGMTEKATEEELIQRRLEIIQHTKALQGFLRAIENFEILDKSAVLDGEEAAGIAKKILGPDAAEEAAAAAAAGGGGAAERQGGRRGRRARGRK